MLLGNMRPCVFKKLLKIQEKYLVLKWFRFNFLYGCISNTSGKTSGPFMYSWNQGKKKQSPSNCYRKRIIKYLYLKAHFFNPLNYFIPLLNLFIIPEYCRNSYKFTMKLILRIQLNH